jgi:predicted naringenin-chalcone synthase
VVANALFADGAAAVVGSARPDSVGWSVLATGACLIPDSEDAMTWRIRDHGFVMTLSPKVPGLIEEHLPAWLESWLATEGLGINDIGTWAVHPGGPRILSSVARALGLDDDALAVSREVLRQYGNMSSPTILFVLDRLRQADAPLPCVALGFGPGLMAEAVLFA